MSSISLELLELLVLAEADTPPRRTLRESGVLRWCVVACSRGRILGCCTPRQLLSICLCFYRFGVGCNKMTKLI